MCCSKNQVFLSDEDGEADDGQIRTASIRLRRKFDETEVQRVLVDSGSGFLLVQLQVDALAMKNLWNHAVFFEMNF